ncbi:MAG: 16S rRNA processing protein RimM [Spirochaetales bacterium]|nr:16S rRNA processing protein RimM [Spirochaetales bacterium]
MDKIVTGKIRTSHGVAGYFKIMSFSGEWSHFFDLEEVTLVKGDLSFTFEVEDAKMLGNDLIMKLVGINTPEEVKKYNGFEITVDREDAASLEDGDYYLSDLIGFDVVYNSKKLGRVLSFFTNTAEATVEVLMYEDDSKKLLLLIDEFVANVDLDQKMIELRCDWILG